MEYYYYIAMRKNSIFYAQQHVFIKLKNINLGKKKPDAKKKAKDSLLKSSEGAWPYSCTDALISTSGFQNGKRINRLFKASQSVGVVGSPGELRHRGFLEPVKKTA